MNNLEEKRRMINGVLISGMSNKDKIQKLINEFAYLEQEALVAKEKIISRKVASQIIAELPTRYDAPITFQEMYGLTEKFVSKYLCREEIED